jgi:truncated hemoglobin YjbI
MYERIGKEAGVHEIAVLFYEKLNAHQSISELMKKTNRQTHVKILEKFILHVLGVKPYDRKKIRNAHSNLGLTKDDFDLFVQLFKDSLAEFGVEKKLEENLGKYAEGCENDILVKEMKSSASYW